MSSRAILVLGSHPALCSALEKETLCSADSWTFVPSVAALASAQNAVELFNTHKPTHVLYLLLEQPICSAEDAHTAVCIGQNILQAAATHSVQSVLLCIPAWPFSIDAETPVTEGAILCGNTSVETIAQTHTLRFLLLQSSLHARQGQQKTACVALADVFGPAKHPEMLEGRVDTLLHDCVSAAKTKTDLFVSGNGKKRISAIYSHNAARLLLAVLETPKTFLLVAAEPPTTPEEIAINAAACTMLSGSIIFDTENSAKQKECLVDTAKLQKLYPDTLHVSLKTAIKNTVHQASE